VSAYFAHYWPGFSGLATLAGAIAVWLGCGLLGNALTRGPRLRGEDVLAGFGFAGAVLTVWHVLFHPPLPLVAAVLGVTAVGCGVWRVRALARTRLWRPLILLAPALIVAAGVPLDEWDSFSHWGLNAAWIWRHGVLPWPGAGAPPSSNPDYPYGYPFLMYLVGLVRGGYAENAGAVLNAVLLVPAADMLGRACAQFDAGRWRRRPWLYAALGAFLCLPLQPWFQRSTTLADYADTVMAVGVLAFALSVRRWFAVTAETSRSRRAALELATLALALVVGKESGLLLLAVCLVAGALVALRNRDRGAMHGAVVFTGALAPAIAVGLAWEWYVGGWLHSSFTILPPWSWQWDLLPALLGAALHEITGHGLFYLLLGWALGLGAVSVWRGRSGEGVLRQFAAWLIAGHLAVLLCAYLGGGFTPGEVRRAASFYRYGTQVGLVALASVAAFIAGVLAAPGTLRRNTGDYAATALAVLILLAAPKLYQPRTAHESLVLERGRELSSLLAPDSRVGLVGWQADPYAFFLLRYEFFRSGREDRGLTLERVFATPPETKAQLRRLLDRLAGDGEYRYVLVMHPPGLQPGAGADMLLYRAAGSGWQRMESWLQ